MKKKILSVVICLSYFALLAQPVRLKLPIQINMAKYNHFAPSLSADGLTMIFATDYYVNEGNKVDLKITQSKGVDHWGGPEDVASVNKSSTLNLYGGHCITSDGNTIYFTSKKTGGVGGYDIWITEKKGGKWSIPQNLGKPINSTGAEGYPSVSADGKFMYFVRCQSMSNTGCESCKLFSSEHKGQGIYKEPVEIPFNMHVLYPRISKDGKTMIFSSNKPGGKGGYDLYWSQRSGNSWNTPVNMSFINTAADEIYADIPAQAEAVIYASKTEGFWTLYRAKLPENFYPDKVILITGTSTGKQGYLQISDNQTGQPIAITRIDTDGKLSAVLPAGKSYDVAVTAGNENFHWSNTYDGTQLQKSVKEEVEAEIVALQKNKLIHGTKPLFDSTSYQTLSGTTLELKRIAKIIQTHPDWKAEIVLFPAGVANNLPVDISNTYVKMNQSLQAELSKATLADKISITNGTGTNEENDNYSGWGIKFY